MGVCTVETCGSEDERRYDSRLGIDALCLSVGPGTCLFCVCLECIDCVNLAAGVAPTAQSVEGSCGAGKVLLGGGGGRLCLRCSVAVEISGDYADGVSSFGSRRLD